VYEDLRPLLFSIAYGNHDGPIRRPVGTSVRTLGTDDMQITRNSTETINGQTIWVTEGIGLAQWDDGPIEVIRPGDRVFLDPGEEHWHGAAPNRFMTHLAMLEVDDAGNPATWGHHVTDEEYVAAPPIE
jgi:mannose-6-phosphate isomerase-like protein (cupin superfamily)